MNSEEWSRIANDPEALLAAVKAKLDQPDQAASIVQLIQTIERDFYARGQRSVQQEIIKALDLRLLLGFP